jgi:Zn-dependent protease with chaperone function
MNFFARQAETRKLSRRLIVLFIVAVIAVVVAVDLVVFTVMASLQPDSQGFSLPTAEWLSDHSSMVWLTSVSVLGVVGLSSLYKTAVLNGGGGVVARSLGGVRVSSDTTDPLQRRLLNVVEEIAIASGVPVPEVYLLEQEGGINAFAAGHNPSNAAIGITRGALTTLNRAELQGVIAHEFSHVLNGDMRINVRLMGLLFGLLVIALIARTVLRFAPRGRSGGGKKGGGVAVILLAAFAILIIGYVGLFFGRLIQAAVSRSRESLADASAVQFTRDPTGLRGALLKIAAAGQGSKIGNPEVEEVAHMLFAPGIRRFFATHPPLIERLKAIDPRFDAREIDAARARLAAPQAAVEREPARPTLSTTEKLESMIAMPAAAVSGLVGNPATVHMQVAGAIRRSLPESLLAAGGHASSSRALFLALALDSDAEARARQLRFIAQQLGEQVAAAVAALLGDVDALAPEQHMPVLLRAFPALRQLTREERQQLLACLNGMLQREGRVSLRSYVLRKMAQVQLRDDLDPTARPGNLALDAVHNELQTVFAVLAQHGHAADASARRAYEAGLQSVLPRERPGYSVPANWPATLDVALSRLDRLAPAGKEVLIEGLTKTITHDQRLIVEEAELLRAICATLHCPLPPLVAADH